jgi:poly-gamma-glutamate synthesis protein (capsule biosynthesis protein)
MNKKHYLLLAVFLILFFVFNIFIYTRSFDIETNFVKIPKKEVKNHPSVLNFGDVMFDRGVRNIMENRGRDPFEYFKKDLKLIRGYDVFIVNLEGPIVEMNRKECQAKAYNFQFASTTPNLLKSVGINMVNIANNHSYDCYNIGFTKTKEYLDSAGIDYIGDNVLEKSYITKVVKGKVITFIGIDETVAQIPVSDFYPLINELNKASDYVIVNIHWGTEYELGKTEKQMTIAHALIDNGADVVFGHHPHVVEPVEIYKDKVIFYSLGNFVFDQDFGDTTVGLGASVEFEGNKSVFNIFPFNIKVFAPELMKDEEKSAFCEKYLKTVGHNGCSFYVKN